MVKAVRKEVAILVEDPGETARHTRAEVEACRSQDDRQTARHVFAAVVADTLDNRQSPRIADGEAFSGAAGGKESAAGGSVESNVAQDDVEFRLESSPALSAKDDLAARKPLAHEVVGHAL